MEGGWVAAANRRAAGLPAQWVTLHGQCATILMMPHHIFTVWHLDKATFMLTLHAVLMATSEISAQFKFSFVKMLEEYSNHYIIDTWWGTRHDAEPGSLYLQIERIMGKSFLLDAPIHGCTIFWNCAPASYKWFPRFWVDSASSSARRGNLSQYLTTVIWLPHF